MFPENAWADSILAALTIDEKIGQFFMISAYSNRREPEYKAVEELIHRYNPGGILFFQGGPGRQAVLTNRYQAAARVPLLIGLDAEWGLGMRLDSTISYPRQMTLGAIRDNDLIYQMGLEIGRQCRRIGVNVNFAPVADINTNPRNPVIGNRSFGDNKVNVAGKASAYMRGLQHQQVIAVAKHFPGHGDTDTDSHHALPVLKHSRERLIEEELFPFRRMIRDSLTAVMSGHLHVPAIDMTEAMPASLSSNMLEGVLRKEMGFKGLLFTDAMNMKGVLKSGKPSEVNLKALLAGNDIILAPESFKESVEAVKAAFNDGLIDEAFINGKVKRILKAKYFAGLAEYRPVDLYNLAKDINSSRAVSLNRELVEASVAVIRNRGDLIPVAGKQQVALISVGEQGETAFFKMLGRFADARHFSYRKMSPDKRELAGILKGTERYDKVVVALHHVSSSKSANYNIDPEAVRMIDTLRRSGKKTAVCIFGTPYALDILPESEAVIVAYQNDVTAQETAAQVVAGAIGAQGVLAVAAGQFERGAGIRTSTLDKLAYGAPDLVGLNGEVLTSIDYLANDAIAKKAFPGCQVLIAHSGKIVFEKSYGKLTYDQPGQVSPETLYDLASVTKVMSTLQAVMLLYDSKKIALDKKVSFYLPELKGTDKQDITIKELLVHQAGLKSFYPKLWKSTMLSPTELSGKYYSSQSDSAYSLRVAPTLFARSTVKDSVWKWIIESPMAKRSAPSRPYPYIYSDLGFFMLQKTVERITGTSLDAFVSKNLYEPLGLAHLLYNPLERYEAAVIAPTEDDSRFRGELLQGTVHDQMAALCGGVAGHAGLFGNARDLAVLLQMNLWKGRYAGKQYIRPETIELFTKMQGNSPRALGWNKPRTSGNSSFLSELASPASYGHTGFTGNLVWVDPEKDLVFIFLSNRVYPNADNNRINSLKTRRRIQDVAYEALLRSEPM
ncbi:MAG: glycoside hydrolase [Cytophagaceae bacterium SCN 52-12]|nr:MAG: glycoside hydrolase [Cytophagaceae bacterium SCN 52-12]